MNRSILIIIPVYNEEDNIVDLVNAIKEFAPICIINDGSTDHSLQKLNHLQTNLQDFYIINNVENLHIKRSLLKGFEFALGKKFKSIITMDAGFSHTKEDLSKFILQTDSNLILSQRVSKNGCPLFRRMLSNCATALFMVLTLIKFKRIIRISDTTSGLRLYSSTIIERLLKTNLHSNSFGFHLEVLFHALRFNNYRFTTKNISYNYTNSSFNKNAFKDGIQTILKLFFN